MADKTYLKTTLAIALFLVALACTAAVGRTIYVDDARNDWIIHSISPGDENEVLYTYVADLNGDGCLDVIADSHNYNYFRWYENDCNSSPNFTMHRIGKNAWGIVDAVDLNNDELIDIVACRSWHENDGNNPPNFTRHGLPVDFPNSILDGADLNNDGNIDLVSTNGWYENDGSAIPSFTKHDLAIGYTAHAVDLDSDGHVDIITSDGWYENDGDEIPSFTKHDLAIG